MQVSRHTIFTPHILFLQKTLGCVRIIAQMPGSFPPHHSDSALTLLRFLPGARWAGCESRQLKGDSGTMNLHFPLLPSLAVVSFSANRSSVFAFRWFQPSSGTPRVGPTETRNSRATPGRPPHREPPPHPTGP